MLAHGLAPRSCVSRACGRLTPAAPRPSVSSGTFTSNVRGRPPPPPARPPPPLFPPTTPPRPPSLAPSADGHTPKAGAPDNDILAQKIGNDSARVKEGDLVLITGSARDTELLENIATYVRRAGAFPMVSLNTQRMGELYFKKVPAKYDSQEPKLNLELTKLFNVNIALDSSEATNAFAGVPPERRAPLPQALHPPTPPPPHPPPPPPPAAPA